MIKNFTFQFYLKKMFRTDGCKSKSKFINDALTDSYGPSSATLKNILAFSDAYRAEKTKSMGNVEYIVN